jgi:hypothetical protein
MSQQSSDEVIAPSSTQFRRFLRNVENKSLIEILSYADQEATAAWRSVYRHRKSAESIEPADQYASILEELAAFLKAAVVYRPATVSDEVFHEFLQLRRHIHQPLTRIPETCERLRYLKYHAPAGSNLG